MMTYLNPSDLQIESALEDGLFTLQTLTHDPFSNVIAVPFVKRCGLPVISKFNLSSIKASENVTIKEKCSFPHTFS